jgi:hypothetical protein
MSLPLKVARIADRQGWNETSILDFAMDFIAFNDKRWKEFLELLEKKAKEENEGEG